MSTAPARQLSTSDLHALATSIAGDPATWEPHVEFDAAQRTYVRLVDREDVEVWLVSWMPGHDTGFHDHDESSAAVAVARGAVTDERLVIGGRPLCHRHEAGAAFDIAPTAIHRVQHTGDEPAVTVHAYSPPLRRMGSYEVGRWGELLRTAIDGEAHLAAEAAEAVAA